MVPLVSNALARTTVLGLTIDMRGYRTRKRTPFREEHMNLPDKVVCVVVGLFLIAFLGTIVLTLF
jgi:energy-coupling factor transport system permease protein